MSPKNLYKTTLTIWTDYNPETCNLEDLGREADGGAALCSRCEMVLVPKPLEDKDFPNTDFFLDKSSDESDKEGQN